MERRLMMENTRREIAPQAGHADGSPETDMLRNFVNGPQSPHSNS